LENCFLRGGRIVKNSDIRKIIIFVVSSIIIFSISTFASAQERYRNQGSIMAMDLTKNTMIVNERHFVWNQNTAFYSSKGSLTGIEEFKRKSWVYIEGTIHRDNIILIEKIYLLPKYVGKKERNRYPFME
jgi:hypothetical protein